MKEAVIVAYGRSAVGKGRKGTLSQLHPVEYGGQVLKGVLEQVPQLNPMDIEDLIIGCALPEGKMGLNPARQIAARAGLPNEVPTQTVNRFCSSGLQALATASSMIMSGLQDIIIAGGVEYMTQPSMSEEGKYDWIIENDPEVYMSMGITAENVAQQYHVLRKAMEEFAVESHRKAAEAVASGVFEKEIVPVKVKNESGNEVLFNQDELLRPNTNLEALAGLRPCFKEDGRVTAGTSSPISDGAAMVVVMSKEKAEELNIKPLAKFVGFAVTGVDPSIMGIGPISAVKKVMEKTNLTVDDMDVIELNEAFAAQTIPVIDELGLDKNKVNPNGGAIALGHPLGATGAVLTCKAINQLERTNGKYGLITMCIGGGMGAAGIIELV